MSIHSRVLLGIVLIIGSGMYFLADWVSSELKPQYRESTEEPLVDASRVLASVASEIAYEYGIDSPRFRDLFHRAFERAYAEHFSAQIYDLEKTSVDFRVYITNKKGRVIFDSANGFDEGEDYSQWNDVYRTLHGEYGARTSRDDPSDPNSSVLYVAAPVNLNGELIGVLAVGKPTRNANIFIAAAQSHFLIGALAVGLGLLLVSLILSSMITRPIARLTRYAREVRDGGRPKLPKLGSSETRDLGIAFEEMRDALEGKQYIESFVQSLTHEIKSPLSAIRGASELLEESMDADRRSQFLGNIRAETDRLQTIVDRLLELASLEARKLPLELSPLELTELIDEVIDWGELIREEDEIRLKRDFSGPVVVMGDRFLLERAVTNLVKNAIEFSPRRGEVLFRLEQREKELELQIVDHGPGIPEYAKERVFERFYSLARPNSGKKSSGLGLNFAREVAEQHGGKVYVKNVREKEEAFTVAGLILPWEGST